MGVPIGSARDEIEDEKEQKYLSSHKLRTSIIIQYHQGEEDHCLCYSMASCLYYLKLYEAADQLVKLAPEVKSFPRYPAVDRLRSVMKEYAPAIGQCKIFNLPG